jgi:hypothetical protein
MSLLSLATAAAAAEDPISTPAPKRRRLNLACNYCRSRKTRCDEQRPSCHACLAAGLVCVTTDPKRPDHRVERREAGKRLGNHRPSSVTSQTPDQVDVGPTEDCPSTPVDVVVAADERRQPPESNDTGSGERFRGLLPIFKYDISSSTVEILTGWLHVAFFRLGHRQRLTSRSPPISQGSNQTYVPLLAQLPTLPHPLEHQKWVSNYFQRVQPVYPVLQEEEVLATLSMIETHGIAALISSQERLPQVVAALAVLQLGSSGCEDVSSGMSELTMLIKDLLGRLIERPTLPNIKALFLSAINVYQRDDLTSAWSILSLCISMATSLRLGKAGLSHQSTTSNEESNRKKIWWSICVFEKLLAFEMGRQSAITIDGLSHFDSSAFTSHKTVAERSGRADTDNGKQHEENLFFKAITSLTKLLGEIGSRCVHIREQEEISEREEIQRMVAEKVRITGEACLQLNRWAEELPNHLRPGSDLIYDPCTFPHAAFLSIHYHNALLVLTRNSILISESALRVTTDVMAKAQPWRHVIRNGPPMVANTARKIIRLFIEIEENGIPLLIPHTNASLHALYVLAVHLLKHPNTMLGETDLNVGSRVTLILCICSKANINPAYWPCGATRKEADIPRFRIKQNPRPGFG